MDAHPSAGPSGDTTEDGPEAQDLTEGSQSDAVGTAAYRRRLPAHFTEWMRAFDGSLESERLNELLEFGAVQVEMFLKSDADAGSVLMRVVERRVAGTLDDESWTRVETALASLVGSDGALLTGWLAAEDDYRERFDLLRAVATPEVVHTLSKVVGLYGVELRRLLTYWAGTEDDWRRTAIQMNLDALTNLYTAHVRIIKRSGAELTLRSSPNSALNLVSVLLEALVTVANPGNFSADAMGRFESSVASFVEGLRLASDASTSQGDSTDKEPPDRLASSGTSESPLR